MSFYLLQTCIFFDLIKTSDALFWLVFKRIRLWFGLYWVFCFLDTVCLFFWFLIGTWKVVFCCLGVLILWKDFIFFFFRVWVLLSCFWVWDRWIRRRWRSLLCATGIRGPLSICSTARLRRMDSFSLAPARVCGFYSVLPLFSSNAKSSI